MSIKIYASQDWVKEKIEEKFPATAEVGQLLSVKDIDENGKPTEWETIDPNDAIGLTETDPTVPAWAKESTKPTYTKSEIGLGDVDNVKQYSASNPPPYPVTSVNGKTGEVTLDAAAVGADASGTASSIVSAHNTAADAHYDMGWLTSEDEEPGDPTYIDADTLGGHSANYFTSLIDKLDARINYLQAICCSDMVYYSTMVKAVEDVNAGTIGANADAQKANAVAGVYTDGNGGKNVVLLKDTTETTKIQPSVDMTINLGGHKLTAGTNGIIDIIPENVHVNIDGRINGSIIEYSTTGTGKAYLLQLRSLSSSLNINGGTYIASSESGNARGVNSVGTVTVSDCNIAVASEGGEAYGIYSEGTVRASNCDVAATSQNDRAIGLYAAGKTSAATVSNCYIRAYSNYTYGETEEDGYYSASSTGIASNGTSSIMVLNDCYVFGTHAGVSGTTIHINGGTYEGYGHGGIYFVGSDSTSYVRNATIRECSMPDGYIATANDNNAGFYIGGGEGADNIKVYMDNCKIYSSASQIVLRGSSNEQNNTLYISRSKLYDLDGDYLSVRIDNDTHKLYIGKGNNFAAKDTSLPSAVIVTDEVYVQAA